MTEPQIVILGANGYAGQACVAEARQRGFAVMAVTRSAPLPDWAGDSSITHLQLDLSQPDQADTLAQALPDSAALIHAAGPMAGADMAPQTQALIDAVVQVRKAGMPLVVLSSMAVYDTDALRPNGTLSEDSPLISGTARDPYAAAKRLVETTLHEAAHNAPGFGRNLWLLRPGAIWGPGRSWHALQGFWASKLHVTIGSGGELPLAHVGTVARAALDAATTPCEGITAVNVFDDDRPTRARFLRAHKRAHGCPRLNITLPYGLWLGLARILKPLDSKLPGLLREPVLRTRLMPLRYPNTGLRGMLGGEDADTFEGMMQRTQEAQT